MLSAFRQIMSNLRLSRMILLGLCLAVLGILTLTPTHAAINKQVNFQGRLTDANGNIVADGTYNVELKLYTSSSADAGQGTCTGTCVWRETRLVSGSQGVSVSRGLFSVQLGEVSTLGSINFNQDLYLSVRIGGTGSSPSWDTEMTPRHRLGAAPTAIVADSLANPSGGTLTAGNGSGNIPISNGTVNTNLNADLLDGQHGSYYNAAGNLTGTVADARLSSNVPLKNAANTFTATNTFNGDIILNGQLDVTDAGGLTYFLTGNNSTPNSIYFGRAGAEAAFGVAAGAGHFMTDSQAGDFAIRNDSTSKALLLGVGADTASEIRIEENKLGFFGVTPAARASATTDLKDALTTYGLLQGTSASDLNLDGGTVTAGAATVSGTTNLNGAVNLGDAAADSIALNGTVTNNAVLFKNTTDSNTSFQIQEDGGVSLLTADTDNSTGQLNVQIGDTGTANAPVLLTLDSHSSDPTGATNGAMYYNTTSNVNRCYVNGAWADCGGGGAASSASYAHAYVSAAQNVPNNGGNIAFDGEDADTNGYHSTVTNNSRLTAPTAGFYQINATASLALNTTGSRVISFLKNGATTYYGSDTDAVAGCFCATVVSSSIGIELAAGDYIEVNVYQNSGGALALTTGVGGTHISIFKAQGGVSDTLQQAFDAGNAISTPANKGLSLTASAAPTTEQLTISNSGQGIATNNTENVQITSEGGSGAIEGGGMRIDFKPGGTSGSTWNGLKLTANATGAASGVAENGIKLEGPTSPGSGTETAVNITSGWDIGLAIGSGGMELADIADPASPATGKLKVYSKTIAGRSMLKAKGSSGVDYAYQPALFQQAITMQSPLTGATVNSIGSTWTIDTTASTPAASQQYGLSTNFATAATANDTAGVTENIVQHYRGSVANQSNGYFYVGRIAFPDASYGSGATGARFWAGLTDQTSATMTNSDTPTGNYNGFQYSTNRGDTTFQFITRNGTTQTTANTTMTFTVGKVYDFYIYTMPLGGTVYWRIDNLTDATTQEGSTTSTLPTATTAMRAGSTLQTLTTTARNYRVMKQYVESDQ